MMRITPANPVDNRLPSGLTDVDVENAVDASGYPLQTRLATDLHRTFDLVQPEWAYTDRESGQIRTLDVLTEKRLYTDHRSHLYVRPALCLLIECKQSEMPYVFFALESPPPLARGAFGVAGLSSDSLKVTTDDDPSTWSFSVLSALGLDRSDFVLKPPIASAAMTKLARKGKSVDVSGADAYRSLVLPLTKSLIYFHEYRAPVETAVYFDMVLPLAVAVIDGPLLTATTTPNETQYELVPWVRLYRHDVNVDADHRIKRDRLYAIDVVHKSWFSTYLTDHVMPFAHKFGELALSHHRELATGKAFATGFGGDSFTNVAGRIGPRGSLDALPRRGQGWLQHVRREYRLRRQLRSE